MDRLGHLRLALHDEPGPAVLDDLGEGAGGKAITGVPQASASIATSELVSGASEGASRQRAALSRRRLRTGPIGPMKRRL